MLEKDGKNFNPLEVMGETNSEAPTRTQVLDYLEMMGEETLLMDGFDEALIGFSQRINEPFLAVYSWNKMMDTCMNRDGMTWEDAEEYISFNCIGAWVGERTPIIVMPLLF